MSERKRRRLRLSSLSCGGGHLPSEELAIADVGRLADHASSAQQQVVMRMWVGLSHRVPVGVNVVAGGDGGGGRCRGGILFGGKQMGGI